MDELVKPISVSRNKQRKGQEKADYNNYMREYMSRYRATGKVQRQVKSGDEDSRWRAEAAYDPKRDGPAPEYDSLTAVLMGDPPIGRRALDNK